MISRNDLPVAPDQALSTGEETPVTGAVASTDADRDPLTYAVTTAPAHGTASVDAAGTFSYTPAADYNGNDSFTVTVSDGRGGTDTARIGVSVGSTNDPPVADDSAVSTAEETPVTGAVLATDPEGDTFTYSVSTPPVNGTASVDAAGTFTYTPALDYAGPDSFVVTVDDGHGGTDTATVSVTVTNTNDPPEADDQAVTTDEDTALTGSVGATDADGNTLTYTVSGAPTHGSVAIDTAGGFSYTPAPNYAGLDAFTITVSDGEGGEDTATINVTINPVNDAPLATDDPVVSGAGGVTFNVTDNDSDPDGALVVGDIDDTTILVGTLSCSPSGACTYTPDPGLPPGGYVDTFTYTLIDSEGAPSGVALVTITVTIV